MNLQITRIACWHVECVRLCKFGLLYEMIYLRKADGNRFTYTFCLRTFGECLFASICFLSLSLCSVNHLIYRNIWIENNLIGTRQLPAHLFSFFFQWIIILKLLFTRWLMKCTLHSKPFLPIYYADILCYKRSTIYYIFGWQTNGWQATFTAYTISVRDPEASGGKMSREN